MARPLWSARWRRFAAAGAGVLLLCAFVGPDSADAPDPSAPLAMPELTPHDAAPAGTEGEGTETEADTARPSDERPGAGASAVARAAAPMDKRTRLEALFAALKVAPDDASATRIGDQLDQLFNDTDSPAVDLLMARASVAAQAKDYDLTLDLLGQVLRIAPDDLGARAKRATIYYLRDDYGPALADIREVLAREPRHFAVLYGFALILKDLGEDKLALEAVRQALKVNPHLESARELEGQLTVSVEGREI